MAKFSNRSKSALVGVHPILVGIMYAAIENTPVDFTIIEGVRTVAQQQAHYAKGRTVAGNKVTNADGIKIKSEHQPKADGFGYAVDLYPFVNGIVQVNDASNLKVIAKHIKEVATSRGYTIEWGGDWKMKDYPHFSLKL